MHDRRKKFIRFLLVVLLLVPCLFAGLLAAALPITGDALGAAGADWDMDGEDPSGLPILDTGWVCGDGAHPCSHILINDSGLLLCLPNETKDDCLMVPLGHFSLLAGCDLELDADGQIRLQKDERMLLLAVGAPWLINGGEVSALPLRPYEAHGQVYVPLRFLCEALELDIRWHDASDTVLLASPGIDPTELAAPLAAKNEALLAALAAEEGPVLGEPREITITFYYVSPGAEAYTASGSPAEAGSIAADPDIPFGTQFYIPELAFVREDCVFTVQDRGSAVRGDLIDIYLPASVLDDPTAQDALRRGRYQTTAYPIRPAGEEQ